jgi:hypothetical protein
MSSTARPVEPTAPDAAATGRAYDDAQVKKTDQALSAWREAFERHHEEQLAREAEQLASKPQLAPWFLAGAAGLALLVAMAAVVARVVAPPSNVSAVSVEPVEEMAPSALPTTPAPAAETSPASAEPTPSALRAPPPPMEGEEVAAAPPALEIIGTPRTWDAKGYHWVSFEAKTDGPLTLTWIDANGQSVLDERNCGFAIGDGLRRCRVGRSEGRVDVALAAGAAPGDWRIRACSDGERCADVATITVAR